MLRLAWHYAISVFVGAAVYVGWPILRLIFTQPYDVPFLLLILVLPAVIAILAFPVMAGLALLGWFCLRWIPVPSIVVRRFAGVVLGLLTYLSFVAIGFGKDSAHPMTFAENFAQPLHIWGFIAAAFSGFVMWAVFCRLRRWAPLEGQNLVPSS